MKRFTLLLLAFSCILLISSECKNESDNENNISCLERAKFGDPETSKYILPFPVGKKYVCSQSYCNPNGGHSNQLAYDFALAIGDIVIASRGGIIKEIKQDQADNMEETSSTHNFIIIEHQDGTVAFYAHLKQNAVLVEVGDHVEQGDVIALSGNSGYTANFPHLHFGVYQGYPPVETYDLPVNFKNAEGPLDENKGLIADKWYEAKEY